jgi:hypothetical protein
VALAQPGYYAWFFVMPSYALVLWLKEVSSSY